MITFALFFSLLGVALSSCALATPPILDGCPIEEAPSFAKITRLDVDSSSSQATNLRPYEELTSIDFDPSGIIDSYAVNNTENIHVDTVFYNDSSWTMPPVSGLRTFAYVTNLTFGNLGDGFSVRSVTIRYQDDSRALGWFENAWRADSFPTCLAWFVDASATQSQRITQVYGNPYIFTGHDNQVWSTKVVPWNPHTSNWVYYNDASTVVQDRLFRYLEYWLDSNVESLYNASSNNAYNQGYRAGNRNVEHEKTLSYAEGYHDATAACGAGGYGGVGGLFIAIADMPISILNGLGSFAFFDVPIMRILVSFMLVGIICYILKRFI